MQNLLKKKIKGGGRALGAFFELGGTAAAECLALGGLDFFVLDAEHGPYGAESAVQAILAAERHGITPLVRVQDTSRASILKMLDIGAMGIVVPFIQSLTDAKEIVSYAKYSPLGNRGFAQARVSGFGQAGYARDMQAHCTLANTETMLIPQCETAGCLNQIEEIAALDGIDGIFIGPYDLSIALGIPGEFENEIMRAALTRVLAACKENEKPCFIFAPDAEQARDAFGRGYDAVACGLDFTLLIQAVKTMVSAVSA